MRRAVVDVGSNSVLLTVCEKTEKGWVELFGSSEVTGLGAETKGSGLLSEDAQTRTLAAIAVAFDQAGRLDAKCVAGATMAVRIASNASEFIERARRQRTPVLVLSGEIEAQFGLEAVLNDPTFASHRCISVIDPGGHSTELTTAVRSPNGIEVVFRKSFPVGALGLRDGPMGADSPDARARMAALVEIDDVLGMQYLPGRAGVAVALGATPTNLVTIREGIAEWEGARIHGQYLDFEEISRTVGWMCSMTEVQRAATVGLEKGREKSIHIGALILERFLHSLHVLGCFVSIRGWRHAMLEKDVYF